MVKLKGMPPLVENYAHEETNQNLLKSLGSRTFYMYSLPRERCIQTGCCWWFPFFLFVHEIMPFKKSHDEGNSTETSSSSSSEWHEKRSWNCKHGPWWNVNHKTVQILNAIQVILAQWFIACALFNFFFCRAISGLRTSKQFPEERLFLSGLKKGGNWRILD